MHIGGVMIFEPWRRAARRRSTDPPGRIARLPDLPRYTPAALAPSDGRAALAAWEKDERIRRRAPRGRGRPTRAGRGEELLEWAGEYYSQRLDRARPLWEIVVLELADGRWAMVSKTHHCMVDGVGSVDVATTCSTPSARGPSGRSTAARTAGSGSRPPPRSRPSPIPSPGPAARRRAPRRPALRLGHAAVRAGAVRPAAAEAAVGFASHPHAAETPSGARRHSPRCSSRTSWLPRPHRASTTRSARSAPSP